MEKAVAGRKIAVSPDTLRKLRKYYVLSLDAQNVIGAGLVTVFAPAVVALVPAGQKIAKEARLGLYDKVAGTIAKDPDYMKGYETETVLSDKDKKNIEGMLNDYLTTKKNNQNNSLNSQNTK